MDNTTRLLAEYVSGLRFQDLSPAVVRETKKHLIDTLASAFGGSSSEPASIARGLASKVSSESPARVLGTGIRTSPEMATFANSIAVRYLDYNDSYISVGSGHPSDMTPACLAVAEAYGASGEDVIVAMVAAYEIFAVLADLIPIRERGWDQGVFAVLGSAAGASKLMGLSSQQMGEALSIAVSSNVPTRQTRAGELSMWKGAATAAAARAGVFAAELAHACMTGPTAAFEGKHGIWEQVTGPFQLANLGGNGGPLGIQRTHLKFIPSEFHSQVPFSIALSLRDKVPLAEIEAIDVQTYYMAYSEIGSEPAKWHPKTRETADHSLPYLLSLALTDGKIGPDSFNPERLVDPARLALMQRITVAENPEFTKRFPGAMFSRVEVTTTDGRRLAEEASYPRGHTTNPMSDADVETKFRQQAEGLIAPADVAPILNALWHFDEAKSVGDVLDLIRFETQAGL